jgi:iron complex outermembrane receptor protein
MLGQRGCDTEGGGGSGRAAAFVLGLLCHAAAADEAGGRDAALGPPGVQRVVVTGSRIAQTDVETALPVQVITREEISRSGVTTVEQLLDRVPANFNPINSALTIGNGTSPGLSSANLRGLGGGSTLVLLNGRRLANYAFDGETVDLNSIPLEAIDRVEVLKDGASAIYGTDAIAGVVNFVLRRDYAGAALAADGAWTQQGGGHGAGASVAFGTGNPAVDGYNVFVSASVRKDQALRSLERDFARTGYRPDLGYINLSQVTFPANIVDRPRRRVLNPREADGCLPPASLPFTPRGSSTPACGYDFATAVDLQPEVERASMLARGTWRADASIDVFAEALLGRNRFDARTAPAGVFGGTVFGDPIYPAGGPHYPNDFAAANGLSGDLAIFYRAAELGSRRNATTTDARRVVLGAEGAAAGWDFDIAAVHSANDQANEYTGSYFYMSRIIPALRSGLINPWGPSGPEGQALLASTTYSGTPQKARGSTSLVSGHVSRELATLAAGPLALALGAELRREELSYEWDPAVIGGDSPIGSQLRSESGSRTVQALFAELNVPLASGVEAQLAARHDHYSDFGSTTNPKLALRWQPRRELLLRGSWGRGFRAPPLYALGAPTGAVDVFDDIADPIRCPVTGTPEDCGGPMLFYSGGNPDLQPETSTQWNLGLVVEPLRALSVGIDLWHIEQDGVIGTLDPEIAFSYPELFADRFIRGPVDPATPDLPGPLVGLDGSEFNRGKTTTSGVDLAVSWAAPAQAWGLVRIGLNGTYVHEWTTTVDGGNELSRLGDGIRGPPVPRWRSALSFDWTRGPWGATLSHQYSRGYTESTPGTEVLREVDAWSNWDLQGLYTGPDGWQIAAGVRNLLNADPPLSLRGDVFQSGYSPQVASPLGRTFYLRASVAFQPP